MKVEAILKAPVPQPIEKVVIELTPEEARGLFNHLAQIPMASSEPAWGLWFALRDVLGISSQLKTEST